MSIKTALCFFLFVAPGLAQQPEPVRVGEEESNLNALLTEYSQ